ncbi:MAG: 50S ribosomal protein L10 [Oceanococcaceae bacterium]
MALNLADKKALVAEVNAVAATGLSAVVAEYRGLSAGQMSTLRAKARDGGTWIKVVKNTLAKRATQGTDFECLEPALVGPVLLAISLDDPGAAARVMKDFAKENESLKVTAVSVGGALLPASDLVRLSTLPTRDQALAILAGTLQAPVIKVARLLKEVPTKTARAVAAVRDQKQAA